MTIPVTETLSLLSLSPDRIKLDWHCSTFHRDGCRLKPVEWFYTEVCVTGHVNCLNTGKIPPPSQKQEDSPVLQSVFTGLLQTTATRQEATVCS